MSAKDLVLFLIGAHGADGGSGHAVEFAGEAVEALAMEGRMTLCNLAVEFGAKLGFVAPDAKAFAWLEGRRFAPSGRGWTEAVVAWRKLPSDPDADFDKIAAEQAKLEAIIQATDGHDLDRQLELAADALRL